MPIISNPPGGRITIGAGAIIGGTAGSILFVGATGLLAQDNANLFYDDTNDTLNITRLNIGNDTFVDSTFIAAFKSANTSTQMQITSSNGTVYFANFLGNAYMQSPVGKNVQLFAGATKIFDSTNILMTIAVNMQVNNRVYSNNNGSLNFVQNSAGTNFSFIQNDTADVWSIATGTALALGSPIIQWTKLGQVTTTPLAATTKGLIIKGFASQSANLQEWQDSSTNILASISSAGLGLFAGLSITDATNIVFGTTTGTKIGTATNQKLGFFNKAPVVQPAAYTPTNVTTDRSYDANATTLDEVADVLGTVIADLQSLGLLG